MSAPRRPTAALVIIGDEILSSKVTDENATFMLQRFRALGVQVTRVVFVPDVAKDIGVAVRQASEHNDWVCTTGGVGPTHDDITIEAIADAFGAKTVLHPRLEALVRAFFGDNVTDAQLRLALVPEGTDLVGGDGPPWPTVRFKNIYIFPGIPKLMRSKFDAIASSFSGIPMFAGAIEVLAAEWEICEGLNQVVDTHPDVSIGSYPRRTEGRWRVRLTVDAPTEELATAALQALKGAVGERLESEDTVTAVTGDH